MSTVTPSRIARTIAGQFWPDVQAQYKCAPGIFGFSCAGHGGVVAVIGAADIPQAAVEIARAKRLTELVLVQSYGRRTRTFTSHKYTQDSLRELAARDPHSTLYEVWVGEEDCNWATVMLAAPHAIDGAIRAHYLSEHVTMQDVRASLETWNPDFLAQMEGRSFYVREHTDYDTRTPEGNPTRTYQIFELGNDEPLESYNDRETALWAADARERGVPDLMARLDDSLQSKRERFA